MRALLIVALLAGAATAGGPEILSHDVKLVLDPAASSFRSEDRLRVRGPGRLVATAPEGVTVEGGDAEVAAGEHEIVVRFLGAYHDGILRGGFFVPGAANASYRLNVAVPLPYRAVSRGRRVAEDEQRGLYRVTYEGEADELVVATGEWDDALTSCFAEMRGDAGAAFRKAAARRWSLGNGRGVERRAMILHGLLRREDETRFPSDPVLAFGPLKARGNRITGTIVQTQGGAPCDLRVPVRVTTEDGVEEHDARVAARESVFTIATTAPSRRLELDPEHHVFRLTPRAELSPGLDLVLTGERRVGFGDDAQLKALGVEPIAPALPRDAAVLALGLPDPVREEILAGARRRYPSLRVIANGFAFRGETYDRPGDGILLTYERPDAPPVSLLVGEGGDLAEHAADSWVVFRDGKAIARGSLPGDAGARADISPARMGEPEPLVADLLWLTDPAHQGRRTGTMPAYKLANSLRGRLVRAGLQPIAWPTVTIVEGRAAAERELVLDGAETLGDAFYPFHLGAAPEGPVRFARVATPSDRDVGGALVLLPEDASDDAARAAAERGAAAVAVVASEPTFAARGAEAAWVGAVPPAVAARFEEDGVESAVGVSRRLAAVRGARFAVPYVYLAPKTARRLRAHAGAGELRFATKLVQRQTSNVLGVFGAPRAPGVLLVAHWDGPGGGAGSAPDAAGVAVLLHVAARLQRDDEAGRLRRPVVVALLGGSVDGHWGARQLVQALRSPQCPIARPLAVVHLDGVSSRTDRTVALLGEASAVAEAFRRAAKTSSLDIADTHVLRPWSDHAALAEAGAPMLTLSSVDATRPDDVASVDVETMRRVANALYRTVRDLASE